MEDKNFVEALFKYSSTYLIREVALILLSAFAASSSPNIGTTDAMKSELKKDNHLKLFAFSSSVTPANSGLEDFATMYK